MTIRTTKKDPPGFRTRFHENPSTIASGIHVFRQSYLFLKCVLFLQWPKPKTCKTQSATRAQCCATRAQFESRAINYRPANQNVNFINLGSATFSAIVVEFSQTYSFEIVWQFSSSTFGCLSNSINNIYIYICMQMSANMYTVFL